MSYTIPEPDPAMPVRELPEVLWAEVLNMFSIGLPHLVELAVASIAVTLFLVIVRRIV